MSKIKIVAIGGGEIGRPGYPIETESIDKEIIRLSDKNHPKVLLIPTAIGDSDTYYPTFERYYGKMLGCKTDVLYLIKERLSKQEIERKINQADIIYVGGGYTLRMLKVWRRLGVDNILEQAGRRGTILSGISAGAICWFKYGNSDTLKFGSSNSNKLIKIKGIGLIDLMACPHYNVEKNRIPSLKRMIKKSGGIAIALENCSALEVVGKEYRIITSLRAAKAYLLYKKNLNIIEEELLILKEFRPLEELYSR